MNEPALLPRTGTLILVRHGHTAGNGQRHVGWLDLPLDPVGQAQAERAADLLRDRPIAALHSSTLQRATATARAIQAGRSGLTLQCHEALREIDYGEHTGRSKDGPPLRLRHHHIDLPMPGGESLGDVERRVASLLPVLRAPLATGDTVVVVAHFWSLRLLLGRLRSLSVREMLATRDYKPANGSVVVLSVQVDPVGDHQPWRCGPLLELCPQGADEPLIEPAPQDNAA